MDGKSHHQRVCCWVYHKKKHGFPHCQVWMGSKGVSRCEWDPFAAPRALAEATSVMTQPATASRGWHWFLGGGSSDWYDIYILHVYVYIIMIQIIPYGKFTVWPWKSPKYQWKLIFQPVSGRVYTSLVEGNNNVIILVLIYYSLS